MHCKKWSYAKHSQRSHGSLRQKVTLIVFPHATYFRLLYSRAKKKSLTKLRFCCIKWAQKVRSWLPVSISLHVLLPKLFIRFLTNLVLKIYTRSRLINLILARICKIRNRKQDNVISIVTRQWAGRLSKSGLILGRVNKFVSSPKSPDRLWNPPPLPAH